MIPSPPDEIAVLLQRPVAVFGGGVSGQGVLSLLAAIGGVGRLYDEKSPDAENQFTAAHATRHGLVIFSPGFPVEHLWLATARAVGCICLGELDFASFFWRGEILAITGTNGKTTLTEFLTHALILAGRAAHTTGNIGYPFSRFVIEQTGRVETAVCEVSSFQAETLQHFRPNATFWTNFAEDHLERHPGMRAYFDAKWRLVDRTPSESVFAGSSVQKSASKFGHHLAPAAAVATEGQIPDARLAGTVFDHYPQLENFLLAAAWWRQARLPESKLYFAAKTFRLGQHRLAKVGSRRGVTFWNDSKATNFHAVEAALATFPAPVFWIGGGKAKGGDLPGFVDRISAKIRHAYVIGETQPALTGLLRNHQLPVTPSGSLEEAVHAAFAEATTGDNVLLSPGFASFDMFHGYDDRGLQFESLVENL
ncbi:MAG TPA: UDP-N-acetylmuramoyl-L-alanine--D-glutamate ligase [Lacunisphaera sp.]|jgi:UDP-N-acetylmuramoylalanine--D-glutamate ligase